jgi:hypothetical protein
VTGAPHTETISAQFDTVSGTATAGIDFEAVSGRVEFVRGQTQQTIRIPIMEVLLVLPTYLLLPASLLTTYDLLPYSRTYPLPSLRDSLTYLLTYSLTNSLTSSRTRRSRAPSTSSSNSPSRAKGRASALLRAVR